MNQETQNILNDLYQIDNSFKKYEKQLIKIINELIQNKPEIMLDDNFRLELRNQLIYRVEELNKQSRSLSSTQSTEQKLTFNFMNHKKLYYLAGALAIIVLLIAPAYYFINQSGNQIGFGLQISQQNSQAFGFLGTEQADQAKDGVLGLGAGASAPRMIGGGGGGGGFGMPAPDYISYNYRYAGDEFSMPENNLEVLKRLKGLNLSPSMENFLNKFNLDTIDLAKFSGSKLQNITFAEDKDFGYIININLEEGSITIDENYQKWPNPNTDCRDQDCYLKNQLEKSDLLDDETMISIAQKFINDYGINTAGYGQPEVDKRWQTSYNYPENKDYIPEIISVIYPQIINGLLVYDDSGYKQGLSVNVNIRYKKVSNLTNFFAQNFQSSSYPTADAETIKQFAENGGYHNFLYFDPAGKTAELELGTPQLAYIKIWKYSNNYSDELIVPCYIFPILNKTENAGFWKDNIVVPLIQDLLEQDESNPIPQPLSEATTNELIDDNAIK